MAEQITSEEEVLHRLSVAVNVRDLEREEKFAESTNSLIFPDPETFIKENIL